MGAPDRTTTAKLLRDLNARRGKSYPDVGYSYFADVTGSGVYSPRVYVITNERGGVAYSHVLNGRTARERCNNIRAAIAKESAS